MKDNKNYFKKGQVLVMMLFFLTTAIVTSGMVIDIGMMSLTRQRMKKAADASALAGAMELPDEFLAGSESLKYTDLNNFKDGVNDIVVIREVNPTGFNPSQYKVTIQAPYYFKFGKIIGLTNKTITVYSVAQFNTYIPISINMAGTYGENHPEVTLMIRGQQTPYEHGDPYSAPLLDDGSPNPMHDPNGYNYKLVVPSDYYETNGSSILKVEIYDPDSWGNFDSTGEKTLTHYKLYAPDSTPNDYSDDVLIATYSKAGVADTSVRWINPNNFTVDTNVWGTGSYRINVSSGDGYNANGFTLRAGPDEAEFNPNNGTQINTDGRLPIRFNKAGNIVMRLGYVPAAAAGTLLHINKFDTDIDSIEITYNCDTLSETWEGELAGNAEWKEDIIEVPLSYTGGIWYATYFAGRTDCSLWNMWYEGIDGDNDSGFVFLVE